MKIKDGDWIVWITHYGSVEMYQVTKITAKLIFYKSAHSNHNFRVRPDDVEFASDNEAVAKLVADKLTSSRALFSEECRKSAERRAERDKHIIACGEATKVKAA